MFFPEFLMEKVKKWGVKRLVVDQSVVMLALVLTPTWATVV